MFKFLLGAFVSSVIWGGIVLGIAWYWFVIAALVIVIVWIIGSM